MYWRVGYLTIHADHQAMLCKQSLMERSVSWANSTPLWGLLDTILDDCD